MRKDRNHGSCDISGKQPVPIILIFQRIYVHGNDVPEDWEDPIDPWGSNKETLKIFYGPFNYGPHQQTFKICSV